MDEALKEARLICADFVLTAELEVDRKLVGWMNRTRDRGVVMQDTLLCQLLGITSAQYWQSIARLHYLGVLRFPMEIFEK